MSFVSWTIWPTRNSYAWASANRELLHPEVADFADVERILGAAVDRVQRAEFLRQLTRPAELADHRPVQADLVDLTPGIEIGRGIRVRHVHDLVRARRD